MTQTILAIEPLIRLTSFAVIFLLMAGWECLSPRRARALTRLTRWPNNLGIVGINVVLVRLLFPIGAVGIALIAEERGWGLFNLIPLPDWLAIMLSVVLLDLVIYLQHVMFHAVPALWRLHRMHHADTDFDVSTGLRFHPVEILLSMVLKITVVVALGPPALAVLIFELLLNGTAMFNHGNVRLPPALDGALRWLVVTPDMHRVHHSVVAAETNSNFGFNLPWWDRLLGTYRAQPAAGQIDMTIGLDRFREPAEARLDRLLLMPLRPEDGSYAINRRDRGR